MSESGPVTTRHHKTPQDVNEVKATETVYYIYNRGMFYVFLKAFLFFPFDEPKDWAVLSGHSLP